jgi:hypothetical protein
MLQLNNQSRFAPAIHLLADGDGVDTLFVVARGTFALATHPAFLPAQPPPIAGDEYWGAPGTSSLKYASDVHVGKVGTDVVLVGSAHAPAGRAVGEMLVALEVAGRAKVLRVIGDRKWRSTSRSMSRSTSASAWTPPLPFATMPLLYERAFGGPMMDGNPVGRGNRVVGRESSARRSARDFAGESLPNVEDARWPLRQPGDAPPPSGFGFVAPSWLPRRSYAGTYDADWKRARAPFLPRDYDRRFSNAASADLVFERPLQGGEPVQLDGVSREGRVRLNLPAVRPRVAIRIAGGWQRPPAVLETVLFEPDLGRFSLSWRAAVRCDKRALRVETVTVEEEGGACPARSS